MARARDMEGGEIYVKKIPSMKMVDIARGRISERNGEIVGIRPGEKLHEQMIGAEDAHHTFEYRRLLQDHAGDHNWSANCIASRTAARCRPGSYTRATPTPSGCQWRSCAPGSRPNRQGRSVLNRAAARMTSGGTRAVRFIPYGRQSISEADIAAVVEVLRSDWLTQGPASALRERLWPRLGARHAVAVSAPRRRCTSPASRSGWDPASAGDLAEHLRGVGELRPLLRRGRRLRRHRSAHPQHEPGLAGKLEQAERQGGCRKSSSRCTSPANPATCGASRSSKTSYGFGVIEDAAHAVGAHTTASQSATAAIPNGRYSASIRSRS